MFIVLSSAGEAVLAILIVRGCVVMVVSRVEMERAVYADLDSPGQVGQLQSCTLSSSVQPLYLGPTTLNLLRSFLQDRKKDSLFLFHSDSIAHLVGIF